MAVFIGKSESTLDGYLNEEFKIPDYIMDRLASLAPTRLKGHFQESNIPRVLMDLGKDYLIKEKDLLNKLDENPKTAREAIYIYRNLGRYFEEMNNFRSLFQPFVSHFDLITPSGSA